MWVGNSKLKKVLDGLQQIKSGAETTHEQIASTLEELYVSLQSQSEAFADMQRAYASPVFEQQPNWGPWEMRTAHDPQTLRESVTFERQGDLARLKDELEQKIREELRQEFEEKERLKSFVAEDLVPSVHEIEARLRSEIEIQVRQEFLHQITASDSMLVK